jgi:hypothetical protein
VTQFLEVPPANVEAQIQHARAVGSRLMVEGPYTEGFEVFRHMYELMLQKQPPGRRWHKGEPLHNMGYAWVRSGLLEHGIRFTLQAFIEDSLSCGDRQAGVFDDLQMPAAQNLKLCGYSGGELRSMAEQTRTRLARGVLVQDPMTVYTEDSYEQRVGRAVTRLKNSRAARDAFVGPIVPSGNSSNPAVALWNVLGRLAAIRGRLEVVLVVAGSVSGVAIAVAGFLVGVLGLVGAAFVGVGMALVVVCGFVLYQWTR